MKRHHYILLLLLVATTAGAQVNLRPGYIITNLNDTVQGQIDFRVAERNATVCDFYPAGSTQKESYTPGDIYAYRFSDDGKFYVTRKVVINDDSKTLFLEYLIKGIINLYYYRDNIDHFFFENEEGQMIEATDDTQQFTAQSGQMSLRSSKQYVGVMTWMFQDSKKVTNQIPKLSFTKDNLSKITKEYHYETCKTGEQCIEFENKTDKHFLQFGFTVAAGIRMHELNSIGMDFYWNIPQIKLSSQSPVITLGTNISIPRMGSAFSFQIEADFSKFNGERHLKRNEYTKACLQLNTLITDIRAGVRMKLFDAKVYPILTGGLSYSRIWKAEGTWTTLTTQSQTTTETAKEINTRILQNYPGFYVGAGLVVGLKKHSLQIQGLYQYRKQVKDKLTSFGGSVGFTY